tara:strand:- start:621 stop:1178 length:558 start_codon:yes stop_codon:yes gene_type:complete
MAKKDAEFSIDQKSLQDIRKSLEKVFPKTSKQNTAIFNGMKQAAKPLVEGLSSAIKQNTTDRATGKLAKSIKIFRAKKKDDGGRPVAFVGPKVKAPQKFNNKKTSTRAEMKANAAARDNWKKKQSGFYFYYLEYGFKAFGKKMKSGLGLLPKVASAKGEQVMNSLYNKIFDEIKKGAKKQGFEIK